MTEKITRFLELPLVKISFLIFSFLWYVNYIFYGIDFTDTFYYINMFPDYQANPMITGTLLVGKWWCTAFTDRLVSIRLLTKFLVMISLIMPFFIILPKEIWIKNLHFLALGFVFLTWNIFNPDVLTMFLFSTVFILAINYNKSRKNIFLLVLSILTAIAILVRFPNLLLIPAIIVFLVFTDMRFNVKLSKDNLKRIVRITLIYVTVSIFTYFVFVFLIWGSWNDFLNNFIESLNRISGDKSHGVMWMIAKYLSGISTLILYVSLFFFIDFLFKIHRILKNKPWKTGLLIAVYLFFGYFMKSQIIDTAYNMNLLVFTSAIICYFIARMIFKSLKEKNHDNLVMSFLILTLAFIAPLGSNTGLMKLTPLLLCFIPMVFHYTAYSMKCNLRVLPLALIFLVFAFVSLMNTYEDSKMNQLTSVVDTEAKLEYIRTTPDRERFIRDVITDIRQIKSDRDILLYGGASHIFYYLAEFKPPYHQSFWMIADEEAEVQKARKYLQQSKPVVFVLTNYPERTMGKECSTKLCQMLVQNGYKMVFKENYHIYFYQDCQ